jgi:hypothetical protein
MTICDKPLLTYDISGTGEGVCSLVIQIITNEKVRVMKTKTTIVAGLVVLLSTVFFASNAQSTNPEIKVLPTTKEGVIKLLVVGASNEAVDVKIYSTDGLVKSDAIKNDSEGFNKRYDVRQIMDRGFLMEVTAAGTSVTYQLGRSNGKLIPYLTKQTKTYPIMASNN